jgi:hypothetical protein
MVYCRINGIGRAITANEVSGQLGLTKRRRNARAGDGYIPEHAKKRRAVPVILAELAASGHIRHVARGLYTSWEDDTEYDQKTTLKSKIRAQFEERLTVEFRSLVDRFKTHSASTVRTTLYRLAEEGVIEKVSKGTWAKCNVRA